MDKLERHRALSPPRDTETCIWHYMSFAKFVSLLDAKALFFSYAHSFPDLMEGLTGIDPKMRNERPSVAVSSWHISDHESEAMWRLFAPLEEAIALRSTYGRLREELPGSAKIFRVRYEDSLPPGGITAPTDCYFYKRKAYEHERELRALVLGGAGCQDTGCAIPVRLERLAERIVVSPAAERWFLRLTGSIAQKFGVRVPVEASLLSGTIGHK